MTKMTRDLATPPGGLVTLNPRETVFSTGILGSVNAEIIIPCDGCSTVALDMRGTFSLTAEVAGTIDGSNWTPIPIRMVNVAAIGYVVAAAGAVAGMWVGKCAPFRSVRVRATAYTSGSATATLSASNGVLDGSLAGAVTPVIVTSVGAASAAVTLTLGAPGAGLRHYVTYLSINRFASAALTAAAAPVTVTTTNLPGSLAFSLAADAAAQGTMTPWGEDFAYPLAASAQNTATTIVCPVTTGVIWRVTAGYYVAP